MRCFAVYFDVAVPGLMFYYVNLLRSCLFTSADLLTCWVYLLLFCSLWYFFAGFTLLVCFSVLYVHCPSVAVVCVMYLAVFFTGLLLTASLIFTCFMCRVRSLFHYSACRCLYYFVFTFIVSAITSDCNVIVFIQASFIPWYCSGLNFPGGLLLLLCNAYVVCFWVVNNAYACWYVLLSCYYLLFPRFV